MSPQSWPKWRFFVFVKMPILLPFIYKDKRKCKLNFPFYCNSRPLCRYNHRETTLPMVPLATPQVISPSHISHPSFKTPGALQLLLSVGGFIGSHRRKERHPLSLSRWPGKWQQTWGDTLPLLRGHRAKQTTKELVNMRS